MPIEDRWNQIGSAPEGTVGIASAAGFWAVTNKNRLHVQDSGGGWRDVGHAMNIRAMTSVINELWATDHNNRLWVREPHQYDVGWQDVGHAVDIIAMAYVDDYLWGADSHNVLWIRGTDHQELPWRKVDQADNVTAMAATLAGEGYSSRLWAADKGNRLWVREPADYGIGWKPFSHADNVIAMEGDYMDLYAVTKDWKLWKRQVVEPRGGPIDNP